MQLKDSMYQLALGSSYYLCPSIDISIQLVVNEKSVSEQFTIQEETMDLFLNINSAYILAAFVTLFFVYSRQRKKAVWPPGPVGLPFVGHLFHFSKDTLDKLNEFHDKYGKTIYLKMGIQDVIM